MRTREGSAAFCFRALASIKRLEPGCLHRKQCCMLPRHCVWQRFDLLCSIFKCSQTLSQLLGGIAACQYCWLPVAYTTVIA